MTIRNKERLIFGLSKQCMLRLIVFCRPYSKYLLAAWLMVIIVISSTPSIPVLKIETAKSVIRLDYLFHFCEYGILAFMTFLAFAGKAFNISYRKYFFLTLALIFFAVLEEFHQKLIPGRSFNLKDIISNISGIMAALIFCAVFFRKIAGKIATNDQ